MTASHLTSQPFFVNICRLSARRVHYTPAIRMPIASARWFASSRAVAVSNRARSRWNNLMFQYQVLAFLEHLERDEENSARTRNARLAAINAFFRFLEYRLVSSLDQSRQIHAIPMKKLHSKPWSRIRRRDELWPLDAPDPRVISGARDRAMLHLAFAAGLRVSELVGLSLDQLDLRTPPSIHIIGKGRRERRAASFGRRLRAVLRAWLAVRLKGW